MKMWEAEQQVQREKKKERDARRENCSVLHHRTLVWRPRFPGCQGLGNTKPAGPRPCLFDLSSPVISPAAPGPSRSCFHRRPFKHPLVSSLQTVLPQSHNPCAYSQPPGECPPTSPLAALFPGTGSHDRPRALLLPKLNRPASLCGLRTGSHGALPC